MSEACQPSLSYAGSTVNPAVPEGTMIAEISGLVPSAEPVETRSPVLAVTVTHEVMSEPELVMNCFAPLTTHSSSRSSARVRVGPRVGPCPGLGQAEARERLAGDEVGQPLRLLLVGAVGLDRVDAETDRRLEGDPQRLVDATDLLDRHAEAGEVAVLAGAAVLLRSGQAHQPELAHLLHHVGREVMVAVPLRGVGCDLGLREVADTAPELLVLARQLVGHGGHATGAG